MDVRERLKAELDQWVVDAPAIVLTLIAWSALVYWMVGTGVDHM